MNAGRTLVETGTAGWFEDPTQPGKKVRKNNGDKVVSRAEYDKIAKGETVESKPVKATTLTTGKRVTGATVTVQCAWVDPDKRTPAQQKLFESNFAGLKKGETAYDAVKDAAGGKRSALPDGSKREIKIQDVFQVRFSPENQKKWRAELRRRKNKTRRDAARKAAGATA